MTIDTQTQEILIEAIERDEISVLIDYFKQGLNIDEKLSSEDTLLHRAFLHRKYHSTQQLILLGANINIVDSRSRSPLHYACISGFYEGAKLLTLLSANLNLQDHKGRIPLMHAIKFKQMPLVKLLMSKGSDSDIEDNNGFNSLMWAVMHLSPEELKEMMSASTDDDISEKMEQTFEAVKDKEVKICDEIVSAISHNVEDEDQKDTEITDIPDVIREKIPSIEKLASYSIKEHLQNLREKAEKDGFDYQIIHESSEDAEKIVSEDGSIYDNDLNSEKVEIENASYSISKPFDGKEKKEEISGDDLYRVNASPKSEEESNEYITVSSEREAKEPIDDKITISDVDIKTTKQEKIHVGEYQINVKENESINRPVSTENIFTEEKDKATIKGHEDAEAQDAEEVTTVTGEREKSWSTSKLSGTDRIVEERSIISGDEYQPDNIVQKLKLSEQDQAEEDDFMKIKHLPGSTNEDDDDSLDLSADGRDKNDSDKVILERKKNVTYLRDGYKDEYKDEFGKIRTVDKTLEDDTFGTLKSGDRVIKDEYGEITTVNKEVEPSYETKELRRHEASPEDNKAKIVKGNHPTQEVEKMTISESQHEFTHVEKIKRPKLLTPDSNSQDYEFKRPESINTSDSGEESFAKLKKIESSNEDKNSESYVVKSSKHDSDENDIMEIKHLKNGEDENNEELENNKTEEQLTEQEQKTLNDVVDPNQKNSKGQTLCWIASEKGQSALLKKLILQGADYEIKDIKGYSCLMIAASNGHLEIVDYLAHKVRNVDEKRTDGHTALSLAIEADQSECAKILIDNTASIETKIKGNSLLMQAASVGALNSIKLLIMLGLDPLEKNFRGKTALDIAKSSKQKKAFIILGKIAASRLKKNE